MILSQSSEVRSPFTLALSQDSLLLNHLISTIGYQEIFLAFEERMTKSKVHEMTMKG